MEGFKTDDEQLDGIKKWIREKGLFIGLFILVIVVFFGGRYFWEAATTGTEEQVYVAFTQIIDLRDKVASNPEDEAAFKAYVAGIDGLKNQQPDHVLTDLVVLKLAADFVERKLWDGAETELRWLREQEAEAALKSLVDYRLAQVLFQKDQMDEALKIIKTAVAKNDDYLPRLKELEGDLYFKQEKFKQSRKAYKAAAKANSDLGLTSPGLQWKIDDLAGVK